MENKKHAGGPPLKILFLIDELNTGGTEKQLVWLAENLPRNKFLPTIGVMRETPFQKTLNLDTPIVNFRWGGTPVIKNFQLINRVSKYLSREKFDILQTQFVESEIYGTIAACLHRNRPVIISTRRNLYHWTKEDPWRFRAARLLAHRVDWIIANSYAVERKCRVLEGIPASKIVVLPNAVDTARFKPADVRPAKKRQGLDPDRPVIGVVGNWRPVKGISCFLRAAAEIQAHLPGAQFVLAGRGTQKQELMGLAHRLGIYSSCRFIEHHADIPALMASFDVAVQPSLSESFSNVLLEYMAADKAIVATMVGDAGMMLEHGRNGLLVDPGDYSSMAKMVMRLLEKENLAKEMGARAAETARNRWAAPIILKKYEEFYQKITGR